MAGAVDVSHPGDCCQGNLGGDGSSPGLADGEWTGRAKAYARLGEFLGTYICVYGQTARKNNKAFGD